jgi:hypothetical protein
MKQSKKIAKQIKYKSVSLKNMVTVKAKTTTAQKKRES